MARINYRELRSQVDHLGIRKACSFFTECLHEGSMKASDFSLRDCAEELIPDGREFVRMCDPGQGSMILEAAPVKTSDFSNITGQLMITELLTAYEDPIFVWPRLARTVPTRLSGEKIVGIGKLGDRAEDVGEAQPYPTAGVSEDYIETPETTKKGLIVEVTKEAIYFDLTGQLIDRASQVGESLGINKEKRVIDMAIGVTNNYKWRGTAYDTYVDTPWDNLSASTALDDYEDIQTVKTLLRALTDPMTGEPIIMTAPTLLCHSIKEQAAFNIQNATQVERVLNQGANTVSIFQTFPNPQARPENRYEILSSPFIDARYTAASLATSTWFLADFMKAFTYMENWPITVVPGPANSEVEFTHDIVARWKVSERGVVSVRQPRTAAKATA